MKMNNKTETKVKKDYLDNLFKQDNQAISFTATSKDFSSTKRKMNGLCKSLSVATSDYDPSKTIHSIDNYLKSPNKIERMLYSEISNYIFSLDISARGIFVTNAEKLLHFSLNDDSQVTEDCKKIVVKIYDHAQLVLYQIENINHIFANGIEETKENLKKEVKGIEKEYISILGIFASIVFAFVGSLTFSASVLQNLSSASIFRVLLVVDLLAFVFLNIVYLLIRFVLTINQKEHSLFSIKWINIACLCVAVLTIVAWLLDIHSFPQFIAHIFPWRK